MIEEIRRKLAAREPLSVPEYEAAIAANVYVDEELRPVLHGPAVEATLSTPVQPEHPPFESEPPLPEPPDVLRRLQALEAWAVDVADELYRATNAKIPKLADYPK